VTTFEDWARRNFMKFFVDTADINEIRQLADLGLLDGVTTNPTIIAKSGRDFLDTIKEISSIVQGSVSAEVSASDVDTMVLEGQKLAAIAPNITVKVPLTPAGLKVCRALRAQGTTVNVTLCFTPMQALLAAKAGATYISPFVGRLDDIGQDGMALIADIIKIYQHYKVDTKVLVASVRHTQHILMAAMLGADVVTVPPATLHQLFNHPLTDKGLAAFDADWKKSGQRIL
jgi:transaldolase